jgi:hypothetical protein
MTLLLLENTLGMAVEDDALLFFKRPERAEDYAREAASL